MLKNKTQLVKINMRNFASDDDGDSNNYDNDYDNSKNQDDNDKIDAGIINDGGSSWFSGWFNTKSSTNVSQNNLNNKPTDPIVDINESQFDND